MFNIGRKYAGGGQMAQPVAAAPAPEQELDIEGQIRSGVEAYMQSQDPAIAVEIVEMLAQTMGIAPEIDPYQDQQPVPQGPQGPQSQAPMASGGMKMFRSGGKITKFADGGKNDDPKKKGSKVTLSPGYTRTIKRFIPQDAGSGKVQERMTTPALSKSMKEDPAKGKKRMGIQQAGVNNQSIEKAGGYMVGNKVAYDHNKFMGELAGEIQDLKFDIPAIETNLPRFDVDLEFRKDEGVPEITLPKNTTENIRQKNGPAKRRRLDRVKWLDGKNKKTESGH